MEIPRQTVEGGFVESKFRESRDTKGRLTFLAGKNRLNAIENLEVFDVENDTLIKLSSLISGHG